jgi:hypothetical protein
MSDLTEQDVRVIVHDELEKIAQKLLNKDEFKYVKMVDIRIPNVKEEQQITVVMDVFQKIAFAIRSIF